MNNDNFFVGRPKVEPALGTKLEPQVTGGEQNPVSTQAPGTTHKDYFVGRPVNPDVKQPAPAPPLPPPPPPPARKGSSFVAKCFPCLFGGGASER